MNGSMLVKMLASVGWLAAVSVPASAAAPPANHVPPEYRGRPFADSVYQGGPQVIPGRVECAYFDLGGEGVAYHSDGTNHGNGELNQRPDHQRPHATPYHWNFRTNEAVSISYTKDFADFNHKGPVPFAPDTNQFYIGWTKDGQWCNYTVNVREAGAYKIIALYSCDATTFKFALDGRPASECKIPAKTGGMHTWNKAEVGTITFPEPGLHLLTFHYGLGNNFAYFDFERAASQDRAIESFSPPPQETGTNAPPAKR